MIKKKKPSFPPYHCDFSIFKDWITNYIFIFSIIYIFFILFVFVVPVPKKININKKNLFFCPSINLNTQPQNNFCVNVYVNLTVILRYHCSFFIMLYPYRFELYVYVYLFDLEPVERFILCFFNQIFIILAENC